MSAPRKQHRYDHRLRKLVYDSREIGIALSLGVPKSTADGWLRHEPPPGVRTKEDESPTVVVDGGSENFNALVDEVIKSGQLRRVLAQTDVRYSNSRIEAFWRSAKNQRLYPNTLDAFATVERLVRCFVDSHDNDLPLPEFGGQTPSEVYEGRATTIPDELADARAEARIARLRQIVLRGAPCARRHEAPRMKTRSRPAGAYNCK